MTETERELLTLAVDGELSPRDARRLRYLLQHNPDARQLLALLEEDRRRLLHAAPIAEVPGDLLSRVMARVAHLQPPWAMASTPASRIPRRSIIWVWSLAASLFLAVGGIWTVYVIQHSNSYVVRQSSSAGVNDSPQIQAARKALPIENAPRQRISPADDPPAADPPSTPQQAAVPGPRTPPATEVIPPPRAVSPPEVFTSPVQEWRPPFETVHAQLPLLLPFNQLKVRSDLLLRELDHPAHRMDVFGSHPARGLELMISTAKSSGLTVYDARPRKGPSASSFVIYVESLTPAEIRDWLVKTSQFDARQPQRELDILHLAPATAADQKELKDLVGVDLGLWKRTDAVIPTRSIATDTGDIVARSVATGSTNRAPEKALLVLPYQPVGVRVRPSISPEIQRFLVRRDRPSGSVALMIVIRGT